MPLIKIDYNEEIFGSTIHQLIKGLLDESIRIYDSNEDKISIFTSQYGSHHFSNSAAEIEVRAKFAEYQGAQIDSNILRQQHIDEFKKYLEKFIQQNKIPKGIVFTITFEDWQVEWLPGAKLV